MGVKLPELDGFWTDERTGIKVCTIGDDGDWTVALGWYSVDAFLAAANRYSRYLGLSDLTDGCSTPKDLRSTVSYMRFRLTIRTYLNEAPWSAHRDWVPGEPYASGDDTWYMHWTTNNYRPYPGMVWEY